MKAVIFDLDGTLANIDERRKLATKEDGKINFNKLFYPPYIKLDEPVWPVINLLKLYLKEEYKVIIFSGRSDRTRRETEKWLNQHVDIQPHFISSSLMIHSHAVYLRMREEGDHTPDEELKEKWFSEINKNRLSIECVFDDRDKVVKMWRSLGLTCFQVAEGNF